MTINIFSIELIIGLFLGLLLGFVAKSLYSKEKKEDTSDYAQNLKDLKEKIEAYEKTNSEDRGAVQTLLNAVNTGQTKVVEEAERIANTFILEEVNDKVFGERWF